MKGLTQEAAATVLGVGQSTLAQWEASRRNPTLDDDNLPGLLRVFEESGLISSPVQLPTGISMEEIESKAIQATRTALSDMFKQLKTSSENQT